MRLAVAEDRPLLLEWVDAFAREALHDGPEADRARHEGSVDSRLTGGDAGFAVWEVDGRPVSLVGFGGPTPNGIRIGPVYTPPEQRGHGYASILTAHVSQLQLDRGRRCCFLYTDLGNPSANAIYARIGYERVRDSREVAAGWHPRPRRASYFALVPNCAVTVANGPVIRSSYVAVASASGFVARL
jgi:predicted GNAT family acetyltransferase